MRAASLAEIKKELKDRDHDEILQICLRLGRFKKDNKELMTYLLFESGDENGYVDSIKREIDDVIAEFNMSHVYYIKKGLQKLLRTINKYIRYSGNKVSEIEILLHFCSSMKDPKLGIGQSTVLMNMYDRQVSKIEKAMSKLHEDLQADYQAELEQLS